MIINCHVNITQSYIEGHNSPELFSLHKCGCISGLLSVLLSSCVSFHLVAFSSVARPSLKARGVMRELTLAITTVRTRVFVPSPPITNLAASRFLVH